jgi:hypothetical protein
MPLLTTPEPSAGPQSTDGLSAPPPAAVTCAEKTIKYGWSGEKANSFRAESPLASRYSNVIVAGPFCVLSDSALGLNSA